MMVDALIYSNFLVSLQVIVQDCRHPFCVNHSLLHSRLIQMNSVPVRRQVRSTPTSSLHSLGTLEEVPLILVLLASAALNWEIVRAQCEVRGECLLALCSPQEL